ncbi:MAG: DUF3098 domain-containing protein [Bacteroidaceae bacterium]|nr:DUF3098 domain-containing protein [Bacteroidaceae bacterium]
MNRRDFAFGKTNFLLLAGGMLVVIIGFILMSGGSSSEQAFDPSIFSARRIKVAPLVCLIGFLSMIGAILYQPKHDKADTEE